MMRDPKITVIDYESGNLRSVAKALEKTGITPVVSGEPEAVLNADALVLPGVGAGSSAMKALENRGLVEPIRRFEASGKPFLGVCVGLQLLMESTEEGDAECLGIVPGRTVRLPPGLKTPHMGWNRVTLNTNHPVLDGIPSGSYFYFVHSYYPQPEDPAVVAGTTDYGVGFCSALVRGNLVATQFHPEKSGDIGLLIYRNFVDHARRSLES